MTKDVAFGLHVGERTPESEYGLMGNLQVTSSSLARGAGIPCAYLPIWTDVGSLAWRSTGRLHISSGSMHALRCRMDAMTARCRWQR